MSFAPIHVVVLAAGQGTRMKSRLPKVLHRVPGGSMLSCVLHTAEALSPETLTVVVGHGAEAVRASLAAHSGSTVQFALQEPQLGTAHALQVVVDLPYVAADSFSRREPCVVPARTLLSQLP